MGQTILTLKVTQMCKFFQIFHPFYQLYVAMYLGLTNLVAPDSMDS